MGDYHAVYKEQEGKTTEWDDLQVIRFFWSHLLWCQLADGAVQQSSIRQMDDYSGKYHYAYKYTLDSACESLLGKPGNLS
jgi:hypothetical protein